MENTSINTVATTTAAEVFSRLRAVEIFVRDKSMLFDSHDAVTVDGHEAEGFFIELLTRNMPVALFSFLRDWKSMVVLMKKGTIDKHTYDRFISRGIETFKTVPIVEDEYNDEDEWNDDFFDDNSVTDEQNQRINYGYLIRALVALEKVARNHMMIYEPRDNVRIFGHRLDGICIELTVSEEFSEFLSDWKSLVVLLKKNLVNERIYDKFIEEGFENFKTMPCWKEDATASENING